MRITLVFPPSTFLSKSDVWPPLGLWYLAAQLEAQGHKTYFYDMGGSNIFPEDGDYDQVWISATSPQMYEVRKMAERTKNWTKTKTVLGGAGAWANPTSVMDLGFSLIVAGESDHPDTIKEIIDLAQKDAVGSVLYPKISKDLSWVLPP